MDFNALNFFNYYQQPNTGHFPSKENLDVVLAVHSNNRSGTVADYNWYFPYAGRNVPYQVIEGAGFRVLLLSDTLGLKYARLSMGLSGNFIGDYDSNHLFTRFSGVFLPMESDYSSLSMGLSGVLSGAYFDLSNNFILLSGNFSSGNFDIPSILCAASGNFIGDYDFYSIKNTVSGNFTGQDKENAMIKNSVSGNFFGISDDLCNLSYDLSGYYTRQNYNTIRTSGEDIANISYGLSYFKARQ